MHTMETTARKSVRSKTYDRSKWVSDIKELPLMDNDEIDANTINFTKREVLDKVKARFAKARETAAHGE